MSALTPVMVLEFESHALPLNRTAGLPFTSLVT